MPETLTHVTDNLNFSHHNLSKTAHILVAEDEPNNRAMIMFLIERQGWQVTAVENGREALSAVENYDFDLVLMNIRMPVMNGFDSLSAIRKWEITSNKHLPVIAVTADAIKGFREKCLAHGFDDYVAKPFILDEFTHTIENYLGKSPCQ